jgi:DNA invertase Pin-like site-specific DNA recombinase
MLRAIAYYRVSTSEQGRSGLGLDAQKQAVSAHVAGTGMALAGEYQDIESGKRDDRPELLRAIAHTKRCKGILVIAKLDRLSRSVSFVSSLMDAGVKFVAVDNPSANELTIHILAAVAQAERKAIGERTRAALAAARARGIRLGNPDLRGARQQALDVIAQQRVRFASNTLPIIRELRAAGCTTLQRIADALNARGIDTPRRGRWTATAVRRVLGGEAVRSSGSSPL